MCIPWFWLLPQPPTTSSSPTPTPHPHTALLPAQHFLQLCGCWAQTRGCLSTCGRPGRHHRRGNCWHLQNRTGTFVREVPKATGALTVPPSSGPRPPRLLCSDITSQGGEQGSEGTARPLQRWGTPGGTWYKRVISGTRSLRPRHLPSVAGCLLCAGPSGNTGHWQGQDR